MKKWKRNLAAAGAALLLGYVFMTPMGALRATALAVGYPVEAVTMKIRPATARDAGVRELDNPAGSTVYNICENAPRSRATDTVMENWIVYRHGPFYTANYYGYC